MAQNLKQISEASAGILVEDNSKVSSKLSVFYNPLMEINRTLNVLFLRVFKKLYLKDESQFIVSLPLAASGVRGIRFIKECDIDMILLNDRSLMSVDILKQNLELNQIQFVDNNVFRESYFKESSDKKSLKTKNVVVSRDDANRFLLNNFNVDYIDIDPFGSPVEFVHNALSKLNKTGVLAVTATDTSALCGHSPKACKRKYGAVPKNNENKKEFALRILAAFVIKQGALFNLELTPMFSHSTDHYVRIYFKSRPGKQKADNILNLIKPLYYCKVCGDYKNQLISSNDCCNLDNLDLIGPLYFGRLSNLGVIDSMVSELDQLDSEFHLNYLSQIDFELKQAKRISTLDIAFGYSLINIIRIITKELNLDGIPFFPKLNSVLGGIKDGNYEVQVVDNKYLTIKTNMPYTELKKLILDLLKKREKYK